MATKTLTYCDACGHVIDARNNSIMDFKKMSGDELKFILMLKIGSNYDYSADICLSCQIVLMDEYIEFLKQEDERRR